MASQKPIRLSSGWIVLNGHFKLWVVKQTLINACLLYRVVGYIKGHRS